MDDVRLPFVDYILAGWRKLLVDQRRLFLVKKKGEGFVIIFTLGWDCRHEKEHERGLNAHSVAYGTKTITAWRTRFIRD